jgi:hypothetical protein
VFIQIIQGTVSDAEALRRSIARWQKEIKPGAEGYLGSTSGVTADGRSITLVRFESEAAARANSERPEQGAWWSEASKAFGDDVTFHDCEEVDIAFGGGTDSAGFVQVIQGRAKDQAEMRRVGTEVEEDLHALRPDILGITIAWHGNGGFTQAVYFTSQEAARAAETGMQGSELSRRFMLLMDGEMTFYDLTEPDFD